MSLVLSGLGFSYGSQPILSNVGFSLQKGELMVVLGPNGAGKTTLFQCILGLRKPNTGVITVDGINARGFSARERARRIAYVPQLHGDAFGYSVFEMVLMGTSNALSPLMSPGRQEMDSAWAALRRLKMAHLAEKPFAHLSGGEKQLVLIARALAQQTGILLMDEPTASLDYGNQSRVLSIIRALAREGYAILLSTHNPQHALSYANRVLALFKGKVAAYGTPLEVMRPGLMAQLYQVKTRLVKTQGGLFILSDPA